MYPVSFLTRIQYLIFVCLSLQFSSSEAVGTLFVFIFLFTSVLFLLCYFYPDSFFRFNCSHHSSLLLFVSSAKFTYTNKNIFSSTWKESPGADSLF